LTVRLLKKARCIDLVDALSDDYEIVAPVRKKDDTLFEPLSGGAEMDLDYLNSPVAPREFLLPQDETVFEYSDPENGTTLQPKIKDRCRIILGIRSCDLNGILLLDSVFSKDIPDLYYLNRREKTVFIAMACNQPGNSCFCSSLKTGPSASEGYDLLLTDLGDEYLVEVGSSRGEEIVKIGRGLFGEAGEPEIKRKADLLAIALESFVLRVDFQRVTELMKGLFADGMWEDIAERCLRCGGCSFVCPTCHCFNLFDRQLSETSGKRTRGWDSCLFSGFTRMAGGINPRGSKVERIRQRFFCKLVYYVEKYGAYGCVGCGRCTDTCPGYIDIAQVVTSVSLRSKGYEVDVGAKPER